MKSLTDLYLSSISDEGMLRAREYLQSRGISSYDNFKKVGYILHQKFFNQQVVDSVVFPVCNAIGDLMMLDCRGVGEKRFNKLVTEKSNQSFIFNIENALSNLEYVIVTESIIDSLSVLQFGFNSVSVLSASVQPRTLHMLSVFKKVVFAFDSDEAGVRATNNAREFFELHYSDVEIGFLDFYEKDLNDVLLTRGGNYLCDLVNSEIF